MHKEFLPYQTVRNNAIKLADRINREGFVPDVIYVSLRGGAYMGNVISEYFKIKRRDKRPVYYAAVVARSYRDMGAQDKVRVDGWTYNPAYLRKRGQGAPGGRHLRFRTDGESPRGDHHGAGDPAGRRARGGPRLQDPQVCGKAASGPARLLVQVPRACHARMTISGSTT